VPTVIVDTPVRAGQRIYARGADLIVTAVVNNGAELIADGSIHVYAPLHGRALAGASGDANARIFALQLQPELVSIAGVYRTFDEGFHPKHGAPAGTNPFGRRPNRYIIVGFGNSSLSAPHPSAPDTEKDLNFSWQELSL
jgi:hypothetical protein